MEWLQRCDWCGWPIYATPDKGCTADACSMRPRPERPDTAFRREVRARIAALEAKLANVKNAVEVFRSSQGGYWNDGCGCCSSGDQFKDTKEWKAIEFALDPESALRGEDNGGH